MLQVGIDHLNFLESYDKLTGTERKQATQFLDKFLTDPTLPSLSFKRLSKLKTNKIWACYVNMDLRAIIYREGNMASVMHVGHHDPAYRWAANNYGSITEKSLTPLMPIEVDGNFIQDEGDDLPTKRGDSTKEGGDKPPTPKYFTSYTEPYLISLGIPSELLPTVYQVSNDDELYELLDHLDENTGTYLLKLREGEFVVPPVKGTTKPNIEEDISVGIKQRFTLLDEQGDLTRLLDAPSETWLAFLHPTQKKLVKNHFKGPVKIVGSAGTGKTVVALHRARQLSRNGKKVLLTTYTKALCANLQRQLRMLCTDDELKNITVSTVHAQVLDIANTILGRFQVLEDQQINRDIESYRKLSGIAYSTKLLQSEWDTILQTQGISTWEGYRVASRAGRGIPLGPKERKLIWDGVFQKIFDAAKQCGAYDWATLCRQVASRLETGNLKRRFDAIIVDEVQDLRAAELMFLAALAGEGEDRLMLMGDSAQRLYGGSFSLKSLGINVIGRSFTLRINYRTSEQIYHLASQLTPMDSPDLNERKIPRQAARSLFSGPEPVLHGFESDSAQLQQIITQLKELQSQGYQPGDIAMFVRTNSAIDKIGSALREAGFKTAKLSQNSDLDPNAFAIGTMHSAKGLEFKIVFVLDASKDRLPLPTAWQNYEDPQDIADAKERERNLLYVSATRARQQLYVYWVKSASPFLDRILNPATPKSH